MSSRVVLLVLLFSAAICNGIPSAEIPEVETNNANEQPVLAKAGPAWVPMNPIVEVATETPPPVVSSAPTEPPPVTTEPPVKAITSGTEVDPLAPIAGETVIERFQPIAADGSVSGASNSGSVGDGGVSEPVMVTGKESGPVMPTGGCSLPVLHLGTTVATMCAILISIY